MEGAESKLIFACPLCGVINAGCLHGKGVARMTMDNARKLYQSFNKQSPEQEIDYKTRATGEKDA